MNCPVCRFWAREADLTAPHHPTCPLREDSPLSEKLRGLAQMDRPFIEGAIMNAAADELDRLRAAVDAREVVGTVNADGSVTFSKLPDEPVTVINYQSRRRFECRTGPPAADEPVVRGG